VVAGYVQKGDVETADQVLEIVEGQVAAGKDDVGPDRREPVAVERLVDLIADREDARLSRYTRLKRSAVQLSSIATKATAFKPFSDVISPSTSRRTHHGVAGRSVTPRVLPPFG